MKNILPFSLGSLLFWEDTRVRNPMRVSLLPHSILVSHTVFISALVAGGAELPG